MQLCTPKSEEEFFLIFRFFNTLDVAGNLNGDCSYCTFFKNYMGKIAALGYGGSMDPWMFDIPGGDAAGFQEAARMSLTQLRSALSERRGERKHPFLKEEYDILLDFVDKNIALIDHKTPLPERGPGVRVVDTETRYVHQEEIDRLKQLRQSKPEEYALAVEESYKAEKIYLRELRALDGDEDNRV